MRIAASRSGEWNTYDVVAVDGVLKLAVNGKFVNGISKTSQKKGYICMESEGAKIYFRNIRVMELPRGVTSPRRPRRWSKTASSASSSKIPAAPCPPPTHIVTMPYARPRRLHLAQDRGGQLGARAAQRMAQRDRAAVHVDALRIHAGFADHRQRLHGERLVQLDHVDVVQLQARLRQRLRDRRPPGRCP